MTIKAMAALMWMLFSITLIERSLFGEFQFGLEGAIVTVLIYFPPLAVTLLLYLKRVKVKVVKIALMLLSIGFSLFISVMYLSNRGLWCTHRIELHNTLCTKACSVSTLLRRNNITFWLTRGDLLAIHRGRRMPITWEHDIDICILDTQFKSKLTPAIKHLTPYLYWIDENHVYFTINASFVPRDGEPVAVDTWACQPFMPLNNGNLPEDALINVDYCGCQLPVPRSKSVQKNLLTVYYGADYDIVKFEHRSLPCMLWIDR